MIQKSHPPDLPPINLLKEFNGKLEIHIASGGQQVTACFTSFQ
jgi:hypothetical protein